ncbi:hypothetical protein TCDM_02012 [Trypanosoma cruzi Dm28c]|uniref:Uncharacterized protein n=1 Tax=Trypanosoma cruzi Dm28c TaxID=1416333 RepID=V5DP96_TRYCR|nr:hypothetical protein TCDM_02012 [Trypanosoma cruzi Dm28c]
MMAETNGKQNGNGRNGGEEFHLVLNEILVPDALGGLSIVLAFFFFSNFLNAHQFYPLSCFPHAAVSSQEYYLTLFFVVFVVWCVLFVCVSLCVFWCFSIIIIIIVFFFSSFFHYLLFVFFVVAFAVVFYFFFLLHCIVRVLASHVFSCLFFPHFFFFSPPPTRPQSNVICTCIQEFRLVSFFLFFICLCFCLFG